MSLPSPSPALANGNFFRRFGRFQILVAVICVSALFAGTRDLAAQETLLELNFQNASGNDTEASGAKERGSTVARTEGEAAVSPDGVGPEKSIDAVRKGILEISADGSLSMQNTAGDNRNHMFKSYSTTERFGRGTIVAVIQPSFYNEVKRPAGHIIFNTASTTLNDTNKFYLSLTKDGVEFSAQAPPTPERRVVRIAHPSWDAEKWYFVAVSWNVGEKMTAYLREFGATEGLFAECDSEMIDARFETTYPIILGNTALKDAPLDGKMAYFLWTDEYLRTAEEFAALYSRLAEP